MLTNYFAKEAFNHEGKIKYGQFQDLPVATKRILNMDKSQTPILRVCTKAISVLH